MEGRGGQNRVLTILKEEGEMTQRALTERLGIQPGSASEIIGKLEKGGCAKVVVNDLARCDMAEAVEDAFRYDRLVLATTTYNGDIFPFMKEFIHHLTERTYRNRTVALMENGSWAPMAAKVMTKMLEGSKDLTFAENTVKIFSALTDENRQQIKALAKELCQNA